MASPPVSPQQNTGSTLDTGLEFTTGTNSDIWATPSRDAAPAPAADGTSAWDVTPTPDGDAAPSPVPNEPGGPNGNGTGSRSGTEQDDDLAARLRFDPDAGRPSWYKPPRGDQPASDGVKPPAPLAAPPRPSRPARASAPARPGPSGRPSGAGRRARGRRTSRKIALPVLAGLILAGFALVAAIIGLTKMVLDSVAGNSAAAAPLAVPAPAYADGLPRLSDTTVQPDPTLALIAQFRDRFNSETGGTAGQPSGQYREPGTLDLATDKPAWVMYVGYNSHTSLGAPRTSIFKLMNSLIGSSLPSSSWSVPAGDRGGSARCAITKITDISVSICAWTTENTFGALMSPTADTSGDELAVLLPQMRLDLQPG